MGARLPSCSESLALREKAARSGFIGIAGTCLEGQPWQGGQGPSGMEALQSVQFFSSGVLGVGIVSERGGSYMANIHVRNGMWSPGFARAASRPPQALGNRS